MKKRVILYAEPGKVLTDGSVFCSEIQLAEGDDGAAFCAVSAEQAERMKAELEDRAE